MTLKQTDHAYGRSQQPTDYSFGAVCSAVFEFTFSDAFTAASDIVELGFVPGGAQIVGATIIGEGLATLTADVGIMDGDAGEADDDRDLTATLLFDGVSVADNEADATRAACLAIARDSNHRGLGLKLSGNVAAGTDKVTVVLEYIF